MKRFFNQSPSQWLLLLVVLVLIGSASAQDAVTRFQEITDEWGISYRAGDAAGVAALYTDDSVTIAPDGPVLMGPGAVAAYVQALLDAGLLGFDIEVSEFGADGALGYSYGVYTFVHESGLEFRGRYVALYRYDDGEWKIFRHFSSPIPEEGEG